MATFHDKFLKDLEELSDDEAKNEEQEELKGDANKDDENIEDE